MSYLDDLASEIVLMAGKDGADATAVARGALVDAISDINDRSAGEVVQSRDTVTATGGSYDPIEMPDNCRRIIELGLYDTATKRIIAPYTELNEREYHEMVANDTLTAQSGDDRYYIPVDRSSNSMGTGHELRLQVKIYPAATANMTLLVRFYEPLTEDNADQLGNRLMLKNGAVALLSSWFPQVAALNWKMYNESVETHKNAHQTTKRTGPKHIPAHVIRHYRLMRSLVN